MTYVWFYACPSWPNAEAEQAGEVGSLQRRAVSVEAGAARMVSAEVLLAMLRTLAAVPVLRAVFLRGTGQRRA